MQPRNETLPGRLRPSMSGLLAAALCSIAALPLSALEIVDVEVSKAGGTYIASAEFVVDAHRDAVFSAFTDFDNLSAVNPAIVASASEQQPNGDTRVTTEIRDCIGLFCRSFKLVEDLQIRNGHWISAAIVPGASDFAGGRSSWKFVSRGSQTRVLYQSAMKPDFWTPPLLGANAVKRTLLRQIRHTAVSIENRPTDGATMP